MLSIYDIKNYIDEFIKTNDLVIGTKIDYRINHIMTYNKTSNQININCNIRYYYNNAKALNLKIKDFLILVVSHEIGHSLDNVGVNRLDREINAFNLGLQYVPKRLKDKYKMMNEINIRKYRKGD